MQQRPLYIAFLASVLEVVKTVAIVFALAFIIRYFLIQPFIVDGLSMEPNFHNRQFILIDKASYRLHQPSRGDVIVFRNPRDTSIYFIKRVIGLPGETVEIKDGQVFINGSVLPEPYLPSDRKTYTENKESQTTKVTLDSGHYFVMGDNREESSDSREWGPLSNANIVGRHMVTVYTPDSTYSSSD